MKWSLAAWLRSWRTSPQPASLGRQGETLAAQHLRKLGWKILAKNHQNRLGEIDLIALDGSVIVFVEVRSRSETSHGTPAETISHDKQRRLTRAASVYLKSNRLTEHSARFDVIAIVWGKSQSEHQLQHFRHAFPATD